MIGVVGAGSMGTALIDGLLASGIDPTGLLVVDRNAEKVDAFVRMGTNGASAVEAAAECDFVVLAVKPYHVVNVLEHLAAGLGADSVVISVAAGITLSSIEAVLPNVAVIRAMPNTPALMRMGITGMAVGNHVSDEQRDGAVRLLESVGDVVVLPESDLDALTAVSGSGPAYLFYFAELMVDAAREQGLGADVADRLVRKTLLGSAALLDATNDAPAELRRRVTSPGGTTQAAIEAFETNGLANAVRAAVAAATKRSQEMRAET